jgi:hypothetical protein
MKDKNGNSLEEKFGQEFHNIGWYPGEKERMLNFISNLLKEDREELKKRVEELECPNNHGGDECCWDEYDGALKKEVLKLLEE